MGISGAHVHAIFAQRVLPHGPCTRRAPTTARNALRALRALQLRRAVLLEGSPGVGKTALVAALAAAAGEADNLFFGWRPLASGPECGWHPAPGRG